MKIHVKIQLKSMLSCLSRHFSSVFNRRRHHMGFATGTLLQRFHFAHVYSHGLAIGGEDLSHPVSVVAAGTQSELFRFLSYHDDLFNMFVIWWEAWRPVKSNCFLISHNFKETPLLHLPQGCYLTKALKSLVSLTRTICTSTQLCSGKSTRQAAAALTSNCDRPKSSLRHQGSEEFAERGPNFLNYAQKFWTTSNTFFQGGEKFCRGIHPPCKPPGYGPELRSCAPSASITFCCFSGIETKLNTTVRWTDKNILLHTISTLDDSEKIFDHTRKMNLQRQRDWLNFYRAVLAAY